MSPGERPHWTAEHRQRIDEHRRVLHDALDDLSEEEARRRLVPSTTLLGLVKHATFVEGVWFDQAITGRSDAEIGIAATVDGSFTLRKGDTIASVQGAYRERWATSRENLAGLRSDDNRRRPRRASRPGTRAAGAVRARAPRRLLSGCQVVEEHGGEPRHGESPSIVVG